MAIMGRVGALALLAALLAWPAAPCARADGGETEHKPETPQELFERGYYLEHGVKKLDEAIAVYKRANALAGSDRALAARALLRIAACEHARGRDMDALEIAKKVLEQYSDLPEIKHEAETSVGESSAARMILRLYDVGMITTAPVRGARPRLGFIENQASGGGSAGAAEEKALKFSEGDVPAGSAIVPDQLVALLRANISPESWKAAGAKVDFAGGRLLVVQTPEVHAQVDSYLEQLRRLRGRLVTIDAVIAKVTRQPFDLIPPGAILTPAQTREIERRIAAKEGIEVLSHPHAMVQDRQEAVLSSVRSSSFVGSYTVDQTGVTPVIDPRVDAVNEGLCLAVRPILIHGGTSVLLEVAFDAAEKTSGRSARLESYGELGVNAAWREAYAGRKGATATIELPALDRLHERTSMIVPSGATGMGAVLSLNGEQGQVSQTAQYVVILIRPTVSSLSDGPEPVASPSKRPFRIYDASLLIEPLDAVGLSLMGESEREDSEMSSRQWGEPVPAEQLVELLKTNLTPESWQSSLNMITLLSSGELAVAQTPEVHAQIEGYLSSLEGDRGRLLEVELSEFALDERASATVSGQLGSTGSDANTVPSKLVDLLRGGAVQGAALRRYVMATVLNGQRVRVGAVTTTRVVEGWHQWSGGTGLAVREIPAPLVGTARHGFEVDVRAKLVPGGKLVMASIGVDDRWLTRIDQSDTPFGPIDHARTIEEHPHADPTFPLDRAFVVSLGQGLAGVTERTITLLRVKPVDVLGAK